MIYLALSDTYNFSSKCTIQRMMWKHQVRNAHQPRLSIKQMVEAVVRITTEDPLNKWGYRQIQEELKLESIHIPRYVFYSKILIQSTYTYKFTGQ